MSVTAIEWAMLVWNAIVGCTRVSQGCVHCYAERMAWRHVLMCRALGRPCKYEGTVHLVGGEPRWTGKLNFDADSLTLPLRRKKPATWFVNSMSDFFHENVLDEWIDRMFAVMALTPQHTFQVLTKRPDRMLAYLTRAGVAANIGEQAQAMGRPASSAFKVYPVGPDAEFGYRWFIHPWPLPNVHLGVSVEDQATADERIPLLLQTPAAVRWVSQEPQLAYVGYEEHWLLPTINAVTREQIAPRLDWIVVGGESGGGARPFDLAWARATVAQCRAAGVPVFVKQLGAQPVDSHVGDAEACCSLALHDRKGGDWSEWPEDLRVREFPTVTTCP